MGDKCVLAKGDVGDKCIVEEGDVRDKCPLDEGNEISAFWPKVMWGLVLSILKLGRG